MNYDDDLLSLLLQVSLHNCHFYFTDIFYILGLIWIDWSLAASMHLEIL